MHAHDLEKFKKINWAQSTWDQIYDAAKNAVVDRPNFYYIRCKFLKSNALLFSYFLGLITSVGFI
jgi:hypothetical protein